MLLVGNKEIYIIFHLGDLDHEILWPRSWKWWLRPQVNVIIFKTKVTVFHNPEQAWEQSKPENNIFSASLKIIFFFGFFFAFQKGGKRERVVHVAIFFVMLMINQSINPIMIQVYSCKLGWPDLPHSNSNLSNSHSPSCSIHGILLFQSNTLALLLHLKKLQRNMFVPF